MEENDFGICEEIYSKADLNKEQRAFMKEYCKKLKDVRFFYKDIAIDLIKTRQRIFDAMEKFQYINKDITKNIQLKQIGQFIECSRSIRSQYKVDIFSTLDIRKKTFIEDHKNKEENMYALTDFDEEEAKEEVTT